MTRLLEGNAGLSSIGRFEKRLAAPLAPKTVDQSQATSCRALDFDPVILQYITYTLPILKW